MKRIAAVLFLVFAGCAYEPVLVPDRGAQSPDGRVAFTEVRGIEVAVNAESWASDPADLTDVLTPVHVSIDNRTRVPLRIAYRDFSLIGASGMRYAALSPLQGESQTPVGMLDGVRVTEVAVYRAAPMRMRPRFHSQRFYIAPHFGYYYPGYPLWTAPWPYYGYGAYSWPRRMPTEDMIAEALPEGMLEAGGHVDGFVYFQQVQQREDRVRFDMQLVDGNSGKPFGEASIPMLVRPR